MTRLRELLSEAINNFRQLDLSEAGIALLNSMGYVSDRFGGEYWPARFCNEFPAKNPATRTEKQLLQNSRRIILLMQFADEEFSARSSDEGSSPGIVLGRARSILFVGVELTDEHRTRSDFSRLTREISKRVMMPSVVLFRHGKSVTIAFAQRRPSKASGESARDVLENVALLRIDVENPHRADIDILCDLCLNNLLLWMKRNKKEENFDSLLDAWADRLSTTGLQKKFYRELFVWYNRACQEARYPPSAASNETQVLRLITRLLFVWFIKEKNLVADELFEEPRVREIISDYRRESGGEYYQAILQNLFFATLNTDINDRAFFDRESDMEDSPCKFHYGDLLADKPELISLFQKTPFINGGLFECLDQPNANDSHGLIDCFSDCPEHRALLHLPNSLFFGEAGIIPLLKRYKFTVEESTPIECEVALDPELLGNVFENLLAAHNPETQKAARKTTGSYYTPREVVDYLVQESLVAYLRTKYPPPPPADFAGGQHNLEEGFRALFEHSADPDISCEFRAEELYEIIARIKILDPAAGSGAFLMGALHKLVLALKRLDSMRGGPVSNSSMIHALQPSDETERFSEEREICGENSNQPVSHTGSDFALKMHIVQNCLFGVDLQPVACQIAKLRFFISLIIDQEPNSALTENYNIRPLPNLESKIVSANTLLGLMPTDPHTPELEDPEINDLESQIRCVRNSYFHSSSSSEKHSLSVRDRKLRAAVSERLSSLWPGSESVVAKISDWNPYDQNSSADWFDPEWMFGEKEGFDIVIGNPPYVRSEGGGAHAVMRKKIKESKLYKTLSGKWDLYIPFLERGYELLIDDGVLTFIVANTYSRALYAKKSREWFVENSRILQIDYVESVKIFDAGVRNVAFVLQKSDGDGNVPRCVFHVGRFGNAQHLLSRPQPSCGDSVFSPDSCAAIFDFTELSNVVQLNHIMYISYGLRANSFDYSVCNFKTADVVSLTRTKIHTRAFIQGSHVSKWRAKSHIFLEWGTSRAPNMFYTRTFDDLYDTKEKLVVMRISGGKPVVCYDDQKFCFDASCIGLVPWHYLKDVCNRSIRKSAKYHSEGGSAKTLDRDYCEVTSRRFSAKFILGVLNSEMACAYLRANKISNHTFFPNIWKKFPIPDIGPNAQESVVSLVNQILQTTDQNKIAELESAINSRVYSLYELSDVQVDQIRRGLSHSFDEQDESLA